MGVWEIDLTRLDCPVSTGRLGAVQHMSSLRYIHPLAQLLSSTASVYTCKCSSWWGIIWNQKSGVDSFKMARNSQHKQQLKKILPQQNSQILWDATAKQDVLQNSAVAENMVSSALQPVDSAGAHVLIPRVWMEMYNSCVLINNCAYLYIV